MNIGEYEDTIDTNDKQTRRSPQLINNKWKVITNCLQIIQQTLQFITGTTCTVFAIVLIITSCVLPNNSQRANEQKAILLSIGIGYVFIVKPILSTLSIILCFDIGFVRSSMHNYKEEGTTTPLMTRIIALAFLLSIICNQFPKWLSAFVACTAVFAFGLASRQLASSSSAQSSSTHSHLKNAPKDDTSSNTNNRIQRIWTRLGLKERAVVGAISLVISLLIENFLIWVVSATYPPGMNGQYEPLQDNGKLILEQLAMKLYNVNESWKARRQLQNLRNMLNVQWALVSSLGASFVCLELRLGQTSQRNKQKQPRTLAGVAFHALMTLAFARIIRTISFSLTVLPSQLNGCYASHFPKPPSDWGEWLMVGFLPNTRGGCNDLILSGHATVTSTIACAFTSVASNTIFSIAVWTLVALDYGIESYQGLHYSVDMWLGCIVTCLLWQLTKSLEFLGGKEDEELQQQTMTKKQSQQSPLDATIVGMYALPAIGAFAVLTVVQEAYINYFLVIYSGVAGVILARHGFTNFLQHVLMCELCFGLGAYL